MTHTPHELAEDFAQDVDLLRHLKRTDPHVAKMAQRYHVVNRDIHRAETNVQPVGDLDLIEMRKERMTLKDQIARILRAEG